MSRKFKEKDIEVVWDAVQSQRLRRKQIAALINCSPAVVDGLYAAAVRRQRKNKKLEQMIMQKTERAKGVYSNKSPYGIAQPGK